MYQENRRLFNTFRPHRLFNSFVSWNEGKKTRKAYKKNEQKSTQTCFTLFRKTVHPPGILWHFSLRLRYILLLKRTNYSYDEFLQRNQGVANYVISRWRNARHGEANCNTCLQHTLLVSRRTRTRASCGLHSKHIKMARCEKPTRRLLKRWSKSLREHGGSKCALSLITFSNDRF